MDFLKAIFLGVVQGLTEFFPVSSSAHLKLLKLFFNLKNFDSSHIFDLSCHMGTVLASIIFLREEIKKLFLDRKNMFYIFLAILPLFPFYFLLKPIRDFFSELHFLPYFLFFTSIILFLSSLIKNKESKKLSSKRKIKDVLLIGLGQAFALIPGISRSASTITSAHIRGWKIEDSVKFSFLLAIPTVFGGSILEGFKYVIKKPEAFANTSISLLMISFVTSFIVGFFAIRYIFSIKSAKKLRPFAIYLFFLSLFSFIYINYIM